MIERILQMNIDDKNGGGAYTLISNIGKKIPEFEYAFDYLSMDRFSEAGRFSKDSKLFEGNLRKSKFFGHLILPLFVFKVLKTNKYNVIHINTDSAWKGFLYAAPAKIAGVKNIVVHSHSIDIDGNHKNIKKAFHNLMKIPLFYLSNEHIACNKEAANWMFPIPKKVDYLFNGVSIDEFSFNESHREEQRKKLGISNKFVIGNIGVISDTKNQMFQLNVLKEVLSLKKNAVLLLVGSYTEYWYKKIKKRAQELDIEKNVLIVGKVHNVSELTNAIDVFLFPSKFEGVPLSLIEAQANGLPCVISNSIPSSALISSWAESLDLKKESKEWARELIEFSNKNPLRERKTRKLDYKYDISYSELKLSKIYDRLLRRGNDNK